MLGIAGLTSPLGQKSHPRSIQLSGQGLDKKLFGSPRGSALQLDLSLLEGFHQKG